MTPVFRIQFAVLFTLILSLWAAPSASQQKDAMAEIGNKPAALRLHLLSPQPPRKLPDISLPVSNNKGSAFAPMQRLDTEDELEAALVEMRARYAPFLENHAPALESTTRKFPLSHFNWREETPEDVANFANVLAGEGEWERVSIPHYGPPLGKAVTYYRTKFQVTDEMRSTGSLFIRFKGVDYKATVFLNGYHLGAHEGVFAPFEFDVTHVAQPENVLVVKVENDFPMLGHDDGKGRSFHGDKVYAATGPGYDDPKLGWHHSPPAMGIYQGVFVEARATIHISDIFVRPMSATDSAEVWLEVFNTELDRKMISVRHSVYGQNFQSVVHEGAIYAPVTIHVPGHGDLAKPTDNKVARLAMEPGVNFLKFRMAVPQARRWTPDAPWLYQIQLQLIDDENRVLDNTRQHFGMRTFTMDTVSVPRGMMYLNGNPIRLRGANTMGSFQQCVMRKDWNRLIDDILLAKLTNMNYIRMTQLPVQSEVYDYFDMLGLMAQTDLPLFGVIRRTKWMETVRQAEEMERLVRRHPSNIMVTYINERFPNANGLPQRHLDTHKDILKFFKAADQAILMNNPDRVIKAGDGDYDPPSPGLPDNHVYNGWYNGHGLGFGEMHRGYWLPIKEGWYFGCGEFGSEGLDNYSTMVKHYPEEWLPAYGKEHWTPDRIALSQTFRFHRMWYQTPRDDVHDWIEKSQQHQAEITRFTTEAFRREDRLVSFAIHLFIDAWPAGWMKTIMDVERKPKKAWFEYQHALAPMAVQLRSDRYHFFAGEKMPIEAWLANDRNEVLPGAKIRYQLERGGKVLLANESVVSMKENTSNFLGYLPLIAPDVSKRTEYSLRLGLFDQTNKAIHETDIVLTVSPTTKAPSRKVMAIGRKARELSDKMKWDRAGDLKTADVVLMDSVGFYAQNREQIRRLVSAGKRVVFLELPVGSHVIGQDSLHVTPTIMGQYYFVSKGAQHRMVEQFRSNDFRFWCSDSENLIRPFLSSMVNVKEWTEILGTGTTSWSPETGWSYAVCEKKEGRGVFRVCQLQLQDFVAKNPVARLFVNRLIE